MSGVAPRIVVVTGLSGAGKASALHVLEDIGYEAIDNPPLALLAELARDGRAAETPLAVGLDVRSRGFDAQDVLTALAALRQAGAAVDVLYLSAEAEVLRRRFSETRRRHPLAAGGGIEEGIGVEARLTEALRAAADQVIDTSDMALPTLRRLIEEGYGGGSEGGRTRLTIRVMSFAFSAGLPREADMVFDVRFLRNPHYVGGLRELTGLDGPVAAFLRADPDMSEFLRQVRSLLEFVLPRFVSEGKRHVTVAVGCTGGKHRSVFCVASLTEDLRRSGWQAVAAHRDMPQSGRADVASGVS